MAIKKYRLQRLVEGAEAPDIVHLETSSDLVIRPDGTSVEDGLNNVKVPTLEELGAAPIEAGVWI